MNGGVCASSDKIYLRGGINSASDQKSVSPMKNLLSTFMFSRKNELRLLFVPEGLTPIEVICSSRKC